MAKRYEVFRKGKDPGKDIKRYGAAVDEFISRLPQGVPVEFKRRGEVAWRTFSTRGRLKTSLMTKTLKVGEAFWARKAGSTAVFVMRAIEVLKVAPCPDPNATDGVKKIWAAAQAAYVEAEKHFGRDLDFVFMGIYNCRKIDGSSSWSQHAFRNGLDFRIRRANAIDSSIDKEATTFVVNKIRDVAAESLWLVSGHYYHAHETGKPKLFGTPSCA